MSTPQINLLDHLMTIPETELWEPVYARTHGQSTSSTRHIPFVFEHVNRAINAQAAASEAIASRAAEAMSRQWT